MVCTSNPSATETETGGSLTYWPTTPALSASSWFSERLSQQQKKELENDKTHRCSTSVHLYTHTCIYHDTCMHVTHTSTCILKRVRMYVHTQQVGEMAKQIKHLSPYINQAAMVVACNPRIREAETKDPSGKLTS